MNRSTVLRSALHDAPVVKGHVDLSAWLNRLVPLGWDDERLRVNDFPRAARGLPDPGYDAFWRTVTALAAHLRELGDTPLLIKCHRTYPYCDQNVDVLLPMRLWPALHQRLEQDGWHRRGALVRRKQRLVEPGKEKLRATAASRADAHLYARISWRHQRGLDESLQRTGQPVTDWFERHLTDDADGNNGYLHPAPPLELVIQAAHICFENYRMTLGEAVHIDLLARHPSNLDAARELADQLGTGRALSLITDFSGELLDQVERLPAARFPVQLPRPALRDCFRERLGHNRAHGASAAGVWELVTSHAFGQAAGVVRRLRRRRHGRETYGRTRRTP